MGINCCYTYKKVSKNPKIGGPLIIEYLESKLTKGEEGGRDIPNVYVVFFKVFHRRAILADAVYYAQNLSKPSTANFDQL